MVDRSSEQVRRFNQPSPIDRKRFPRHAIVIKDLDGTRQVININTLGPDSEPVRVIRIKRKTTQHQNA